MIFERPLFLEYCKKQSLDKLKSLCTTLTCWSNLTKRTLNNDARRKFYFLSECIHNNKNKFIIFRMKLEKWKSFFEVSHYKLLMMLDCYIFSFQGFSPFKFFALSLYLKEVNLLVIAKNSLNTSANLELVSWIFSLCDL